MSRVPLVPPVLVSRLWTTLALLRCLMEAVLLITSSADAHALPLDLPATTTMATAPRMKLVRPLAGPGRLNATVGTSPAPRRLPLPSRPALLVTPAHMVLARTTMATAAPSTRTATVRWAPANVCPTRLSRWIPPLCPALIVRPAPPVLAVTSLLGTVDRTTEPLECVRVALKTVSP